jgi:hypothetical protein
VPLAEFVGMEDADAVYEASDFLSAIAVRTEVLSEYE